MTALAWLALVANGADRGVARSSCASTAALGGAANADTRTARCRLRHAGSGLRRCGGAAFTGGLAAQLVGMPGSAALSTSC